MTPIYKEARFPADYREAEVGQIMGAVYKLRSITITGLAGMGKSNVVRFIVSHPQVRQRYLKERADDYAFVHVDCASLADSDETGVLSEIAAQLHYDGIAPGVAHLPQIPRSIRHVLREQILGIPPNMNLVLVLDYFDEAAAKLDKPFFNYLFHLRNTRPRGNLSYIFATRRPMGHLHELHELLDDGCVIGPLSTKDALGSILRDEARLGHGFDATQRHKLIACTGGHPGFLKNATELLGCSLSASSGKVDGDLTEGNMARQMLQASKVVNLCEELWSDLTPAEQAVLGFLALAGPQSGAPSDVPVSKSVDPAAVAFLLENGILVEKKDGPGGPPVVIFCPLFETFVHRLQPDVSGAVRITAVFPNQARVESPTGQASITLPPKLFALLLALAEARGQVLPTDEIIAQVYGDEAGGVTDAALSQLVKRLRGVLDPPARKMTGDPEYTCVETIRNVGYRFMG